MIYLVMCQRYIVKGKEVIQETKLCDKINPYVLISSMTTLSILDYTNTCNTNNTSAVSIIYKAL